MVGGIPGSTILGMALGSPGFSQVLVVVGQAYLRSEPWSVHSYCSCPGRLATKGLSCTISKASQMASSVCSSSMSRFIRREPGNSVGSWLEGAAGQSRAQLGLRPRPTLFPRPHLGDDGDSGAQRVQPHVCDGDPVDPNPPLGCLQKPQEAPGQGGLPGPCPANDAHLWGGEARLVLSRPGQRKAGHRLEGPWASGQGDACIQDPSIYPSSFEHPLSCHLSTFPYIHPFFLHITVFLSPLPSCSPFPQP